MNTNYPHPGPLPSGGRGGNARSAQSINRPANGCDAPPSPIRWERAGIKVSSIALSTLLIAGQLIQAQEKPGFFLPKSPIAAAYVLGRLSNKDLAAAPRGEFVYTALLERQGLEKKYKIEALQGLAALRKTDSLTELLTGFDNLDKKGEEAQPAAEELLPILVQAMPSDLAAKRERIEKLATDAQTPFVRQAANAALILADQSVEKAWTRAESSDDQMIDLLRGAALLPNARLAAGVYAKITPLLERADKPELSRAAMLALASIPGREPETFATLSGLMRAGGELPGIVAGLQRLPRKTWPPAEAGPLMDALLEQMQKVAPEQRTESPFLAAMQFASDLSSLLPASRAQAVQKSLRGMGVAVVVIRPIYEQMLFDKQLIVAETGRPVEIVLENTDIMPHNLVIVTSGAIEEIGTLAEKMQPEPDAEGRVHVPNSPKVLQATKMLEPGQKAKLTFLAPSEPGEFDYLCSFPGHWRRMVGKIAVVKDVDAYLASRPAEPKMMEWTLADLAPDLGHSTGNAASGKALFAALACVQCHKIGPEGTTYGPDLTEVFQRWKGDRAAVLGEILEPSKVIVDRYRIHQFDLADGESVTGMILKEDSGSVTIQTGPADTLIQNLKKSEIKKRQPQPSSIMPVGLLNMSSKQQIFDLLAYLESGGNPGPAHPH